MEKRLINFIINKRLIIEKILEKYFNNKLKKDIDYPEYFDISYANEYIDLKSDIKSILIDKLRNSQFKSELEKQLTQYFDISNPNISNVNINIITPFNFRVEYSIPIREVGIYANILSNIDEPVEIDNFCMTNIEIKDMCRSKDLWIHLMMNRFPKYFIKGNYNWESIYKGLLYYNSDKGLNMKILEYPDFIKYMVENKFIDYDYDTFIQIMTHIKWVFLDPIKVDSIIYLIDSHLIKLNELRILVTIVLENINKNKNFKEKDALRLLNKIGDRMKAFKRPINISLDSNKFVGVSLPIYKKLESMSIILDTENTFHHYLFSKYKMLDKYLLNKIKSSIDTLDYDDLDTIILDISNFKGDNKEKLVNLYYLLENKLDIKQRQRLWNYIQA